MDFKDYIKQLGDRVVKLKEQIATEEATKNAFILPFIQCLGYDVFNPLEVVPEFVADIGLKKGEKVDYAIIKDGVPIILIECKHWAQKLDIHDNQLLRYFNVTKAKFAILTNGVRYRFYTDLVEPNIMDEKPFLEFDIAEIKDAQTEELKKFHKSYFDINNILSSASELKYTSELKSLIANELRNPSEDFVRLFTKKVYPRTITASVLNQFTDLVKKSSHQVMSDIINERLKSAMDKDNDSLVLESLPTDTAGVEQTKTREVETTAEELEAFIIVKSILRTVVDVSRISYKDSLTYFSVILDESSRKTVCRIYLNSNKKYIGVFDSSKKETKNEINSLDDIFRYAESMKDAAGSYLTTK
ncbi:MAG TPA: type I restriction endonuclease [Chitinophagales bacterium]|nr:type I restriction endonuclease [Chitinophagales bacterium]